VLRSPRTLSIAGITLAVIGLVLLGFEVARTLGGTPLGGLGTALLWVGVGLVTVGVVLLTAVLFGGVEGAVRAGATDDTVASEPTP